MTKSNPKALKSIPDLVTRLYAGYERPDHLMPIVELLERSLVEEVRTVISIPPQHGKTTILLATLIKCLALHRHTSPPAHSAYITYNEARAHQMSDECRKLARTAELEVEGTPNKWGVPEGPDILWGGVGPRTNNL